MEQWQSQRHGQWQEDCQVIGSSSVYQGTLGDPTYSLNGQSDKQENQEKINKTPSDKLDRTGEENGLWELPDTLLLHDVSIIDVLTVELENRPANKPVTC